MGIRETFNENRSVTVGATIGITVLAIFWIIYYSLNMGRVADDNSIPVRQTTAPTSN